MDPEHSSESDQCVLVAAQLSSERGRVRLLDRAACVLGGRWCAASVRAPLAPYEGSDPPHDLSSSVKRKTEPACASAAQNLS
jgi:hypothetical protein